MRSGKVATMSSFKSKLVTNPFKKLVHLFTFTLNKPTGFSIKSIRPRSSNKRNKQRRRRSSKSKLGDDDDDDDDSMMIMKTRTRSSSGDNDTTMNTRLYTSPARGSSTSSDDKYNGGDVEDACRLFEKYLMDMIVQDGKVGDLTDVEDLLFSWTQLKSPLFIDLVSTFYGELCLDLFSHQERA